MRRIAGGLFCYAALTYLIVAERLLRAWDSVVFLFGGYDGGYYDDDS